MFDVQDPLEEKEVCLWKSHTVTEDPVQAKRCFVDEVSQIVLPTAGKVAEEQEPAFREDDPGVKVDRGDKHNVAVFENVPAGNYTLKVVSSNYTFPYYYLLIFAIFTI